MQAPIQTADNPLPEILSDETYHFLDKHNLLRDKGVRDYLMRQKFETLRNREVPASEAIEKVREDYPYLQFDTIRKIVYKINA